MGHREIYPNPPLVMVVLELRHPQTLTLTDAQQAALKAALVDMFPLSKPVQRWNGTFVPTGSAQEAQLVTDPRYMTRDHGASITYRPDAIVVEATRYVRRSQFRDIVRLAVDTRQRVAPVDGVERVGIRYINEVRVPGIEAAGDWLAWISSAVASQADLRTQAGDGPRAWQGLTTFGDQERGIVLRYGTLDGYAVDPAGELRRETPTPGPFYLLDLDCYWMPSGDTPPLTWKAIEPRFDDAALSAFHLFEQLVTEKYRSEVMRGGSTDGGAQRSQ
jgi:uncharacterized protein (TIGR04255 family)